MVFRKDCMKLWVIVLYVSIATFLFIRCDARITRSYTAKHLPQGIRHEMSSSIKVSKRLKSSRHLDLSNPSLDLYKANAPNSLPPFDYTMGSLSPSYLPQNTPPYCVYPPFTPLPPSITVPTPIVYAQPPPPPPSYSTPTFPIVSPPPSIIPSPPPYSRAPPEYVPGPPNFKPSPPNFERSPPEYVPSPPESTPTPPVFLPPIVFPPPAVLTPPYSGPRIPLWCVAKPTVPDPIIQEAMNYACGSGADCGSIQPNGTCYNPDKLILHASYAFNSYWQRTKSAGGTCDFGGTAILITKDPSFDGCHFILN